MDWAGCDLVESTPEKVSGQPVIVGTRILADSIPENYEAFLAEGLSPDGALAETLDCFPGAGLDHIKGVLSYYYAHRHQLQH